MAIEDAVWGIVRAFDDHPVVAIAEWHWLRQAGDFYSGLANDASIRPTSQV